MYTRFFVESTKSFVVSGNVTAGMRSKVKGQSRQEAGQRSEVKGQSRQEAGQRSEVKGQSRQSGRFEVKGQ
jgi:hypothetical protein